MESLTGKQPVGNQQHAGVDADGMPGKERTVLSDAALGTPRRLLSYKTSWYGSQLVVADRWFASSKTCHACGHAQDIG
jgi:putative transposase